MPTVQHNFRIYRCSRTRSSKEKYDVAFGSRAHMAKDAKAKRAWYRNIFMHGLHMIVKVIIIAGGHEIRDTQCGFKLFSKQA